MPYRSLPSLRALSRSLLLCSLLATGLAAQAQTARVIVKLQGDSSGAATRQSVQAESAERSTQRVKALGQKRHVALKVHSTLGERTQVVTAEGLTSEALAQQLAGDADVAYAVPDRRVRRAAAPNDPRYDSVSLNAGGPTVGQWYLKSSNTYPSAVNAETAWDITSGSPEVVIAVLDTGVRFDHPDLGRVADGGKLLPGYDFVSETDISNDGNGRDSDASDPGDWVSDREAGDEPFEDCDAADSSWHGTQVSGILGALTNNNVGMAGLASNVRLLPLRVLGKCYGYQSDIIAAMRWASGLSVGGVPSNSHPARVINLSLGSVGVACDSSYQDAIDAVRARGSVVVVSAGNSDGHALGAPANCQGAIAVAGLRQAGTKVGFSDLGADVAISAPAGNCGDGSSCGFPLLTTTDSGTTSPSGSAYTDGFNATAGTSFSAPLVAATAALMLSGDESLTPAQVLTNLRATARTFPTTGALDTTAAACQAPNPIGSTQVNQGECYCTTTTCGAGMLDARAAVQAVFKVQAEVEATPANPDPGQAVTLDASGTLVGAGRTVASYAWSLVDDGGIVGAIAGSTTGPTVNLTPTADGSFTVRVVVTDSTGATSTRTQEVSVGDGGSSGGGGDDDDDDGGGGGALGLGWLMALAAAVAATRRLQRRA